MPPLSIQHRFAGWTPYLVAPAVVGFCSLASWGSHALGLTEANIVMIFLAGVALVAARFGHGPAITAAILSVLVFDFFFVKPVFGFNPSDAQYFLTLGVMLGIGLLISELVARLRDQLLNAQEQEHRATELFQSAQQRERRTAQLYRMTQKLSTSAGFDLLVLTAGEQLAEAFEGQVGLYLREADGSLKARFGQGTLLTGSEANRVAAQWSLENGQVCGLGTDRHPTATATFVPMIGSKLPVGVLGVCVKNAQQFHDPEERRMLETCANLIALTIERDQSQQDVQQAQVQVQTEKLRSALLSAVSHDLRTPLATIAVTASSLVEDVNEQKWPEKLELLQTVVDESHRLARQVDNLLDMARLDSGAVALNCDWQVLEELVGLALARVRGELKGRTIHVSLPDPFPLLWVAGDLILQLLVNLLENAIRYTPTHSRIDISATHVDERVEIRVADNGPGLPRGSESKVFDKFYRGNTVVADGRRGVGLGLAICQAITQAHGGQISAANRASGGAEFVVSLPCPIPDPEDNLDEAAATLNS